MTNKVPFVMDNATSKRFAWCRNNENFSTDALAALAEVERRVSIAEQNQEHTLSYEFVEFTRRLEMGAAAASLVAEDDYDEPETRSEKSVLTSKPGLLLRVYISRTADWYLKLEPLSLPMSLMFVVLLHMPARSEVRCVVVDRMDDGDDKIVPLASPASEEAPPLEIIVWNESTDHLPPYLQPGYNVSPRQLAQFRNRLPQFETIHFTPARNAAPQPQRLMQAFQDILTSSTNSLANDIHRMSHAAIHQADEREMPLLGRSARSDPDAPVLGDCDEADALAVEIFAETYRLMRASGLSESDLPETLRMVASHFCAELV